jgi:hypothetical protein
VNSAPSPALEPTRHVASRVFVRVAEIGQVLVPGIYAWAVTVVPAATERTHTGSVATAFLAFALLVAGAFLAKERPSLGYALGIWGFMIACLITWLISMPALQVERLDPWRAGAGSIGWILYALGWGTPWRIGRHPEDDPRAQLHPKLEPRNPPRLRTALSVATGTIGALLCLLLAWRITESDRAMLLHGAALACAVGIINTAATIGLGQGKKRILFSPKQRITFAFPWIMAIIALLVISAAWLLGN